MGMMAFSSPRKTRGLYMSHYQLGQKGYASMNVVATDGLRPEIDSTTVPTIV